MTAPATGRTADENEMRETLARFLWDTRYGQLPDASWSGARELAKAIPDGAAASAVGAIWSQADRLLSGPLAPILQEAATARKERDEALKLARMGFREKHVFLALGQAEAIADRKAAEAEAAHLRAENANLRDRVREAEGAGRDPDGSGSRPSDQAASHPAPAGFDPSRAPWPSGCIKPNACSRHRQCMYAQSPKQCRHLSKDLTPDIEAAEALHAR